MSVTRAGHLHAALFNGNGVAKKLIVALVLFSSAITGVITAIELYAHYRRDLGQIDRSIEFIGRSYLPSLTDSVWIADRQQVQTQLDGLLRLLGRVQGNDLRLAGTGIVAAEPAR